MEQQQSQTDTIVGIVLAAGTSTRFGSENKLLTKINDRPIIQQSTATLCTTSLDEVIVVVGHDAEVIRNVLSDLPVRCVENERYAEGQSTSVHTGIQSVKSTADAVVIALGDMPFVQVSSVNRLIDEYRSGAGNALALSYEGTRGNPVLFGREFFEQLTEINGDIGGREILLESGTLIETGDPGVRRDIDVPSDIFD